MSAPNPPQTASLRTRKKQEARTRMLAAARRLFTAQGVDHVSMEDVAAAAEVSAGTLYNYFPTKADLAFHAVIAGAAEQVLTQESAVLAPAATLEAALTRAVDGFLHFVGQFDRPMLRQLLMLAYQPQATYGRDYAAMSASFTDQLGRILLACKSDGRLPAIVDDGALTRIIANIAEAEVIAYVRSEAMAMGTLRAAILTQIAVLTRLIAAQAKP